MWLSKYSKRKLFHILAVLNVPRVISSSDNVIALRNSLIFSGDATQLVKSYFSDQELNTGHALKALSHNH